jgi:hypothetical protein
MSLTVEYISLALSLLSLPSSYSSIFSLAQFKLEKSSQHFTNQIVRYHSTLIKAILFYRFILAPNMPHFNRSTTGTEVVEAFAGRVTRKTCKPLLPKHVSMPR